jgi:hypothetical protein
MLWFTGIGGIRPRPSRDRYFYAIVGTVSFPHQVHRAGAAACRRDVQPRGRSIASLIRTNASRPTVTERAECRFSGFVRRGSGIDRKPQSKESFCPFWLFWIFWIETPVLF